MNSNPPSKCALTGYPFGRDAKILENTPDIISYEFTPVGKVLIEPAQYCSLLASNQGKHPIFAGICRNAFAKKLDPPLIDKEFVDGGYKRIAVPQSIQEKITHLLRLLYDLGGNDYRTFDFTNSADYTLAYAKDQEEFSQIIEQLKRKGFIEISTSRNLSSDRTQYLKLELTDLGKSEIEKALPKMPMISLVNQEITTGDISIDNKITHAKKLFFDSPQTLNNMRSACETLSFVLEPLRDKFPPLSLDVEAFFQIVNKFDVRHNKDHTVRLVYPEQLEWIFYGLLNSINAYIKLQSRLENNPLQL